MNPVWAIEIKQPDGPRILLVIEVATEQEAPPAVHLAANLVGSLDRQLTGLGWQASSWRPRSYGGICRLQARDSDQ
jgi:hypothetical protein